MRLYDLANDLGLFAIIVLGATWLLKASVAKWLDRSVDAYKVKLEGEHAISLERFRAELQKASLEHEVRFTRFHEKRAATIEQLYLRLARLLRAADAFFPGIHVNQALAKEFEEALREIRTYLDENLIYVSEQQSADIFSLSQRLHAAAMDKHVLAQDDFPDKEGRDERIQSLQERWKLIQEVAPGVKKKLVDDFRSILSANAPTIPHDNP